jgi:hypothetical protein
MKIATQIGSATKSNYDHPILCLFFNFEREGSIQKRKFLTLPEIKPQLQALRKLKSTECGISVSH